MGVTLPGGVLALMIDSIAGQLAKPRYEVKAEGIEVFYLRPRGRRVWMTKPFDLGKMTWNAFKPYIRQAVMRAALAAVAYGHAGEHGLKMIDGRPLPPIAYYVAKDLKGFDKVLDSAGIPKVTKIVNVAHGQMKISPSRLKRTAHMAYDIVQAIEAAGFADKLATVLNQLKTQDVDARNLPELKEDARQRVEWLRELAGSAVVLSV